METLFIYLIKSGGLIGMFYFAYHFMLREETFFNSNRWFLLTGLISSAVLPLLFFTKKIWIETSPTNIDFSKIPLTTLVVKESFEINWYIVFAIVYGLGIVLFLLKLALDFYSLSKVLKGKTIQQQSDFKFINVAEKVSPFSYFNYIVYNSDLYSEAELENILEHEKVHSSQNHTVDVLISRLFCIVFWFNPFVWLYKKAIEQNLEFIADSEALKNISDKKAYQITLLKITTQENCVAISNHFYQSLIKKRIVMLNKNQSNKRNSWKYTLVLPLLVAFMFLFQIKVIAQKKEPEIINNNILKNNSNSGDSKVTSSLSADKEIFINGLEVSQNDLDKLDPNDIETMNVDKNSAKSTIKIITKKGSNIPGDTEIFINGEKVSKEEMEKIDNSSIETINVDKNYGKSTIKIITKKGSNIPEDTEIFINGEKVSKEEMEKIDNSSIETLNVDKNSGKPTIKIITKKGSNISGDTEIFMNGKKISTEEMGKIDNSMIETVNVSKTGTTKKTIKIITRKTEINNSSDVLEQAKIDAHQAKKDTEQARKDALQAKIDAEQARKDAQQAKKDALQAKKDAQQAKIEAEKSKKGK